MQQVEIELANGDKLLLVERTERMEKFELDPTNTILVSYQNFDLPQLGKYKLLGTFDLERGINWPINPDWLGWMPEESRQSMAKHKDGIDAFDMFLEYETNTIEGQDVIEWIVLLIEKLQA